MAAAGSSKLTGSPSRCATHGRRDGPSADHRHLDGVVVRDIRDGRHVHPDGDAGVLRGELEGDEVAVDGRIDELVGVRLLRSTVTVEVVNRASGGWLAENNLNMNRLEYFYWLLAGLRRVNFGVYLACASWYRYKSTNVEVKKSEGLVVKIPVATN
ncbi:protein NRT1/ PTR FAMILY 4.5-like [Iris pallida]|uniref:Protein NRT1/ PTR FAMILY 4.5-like n=1 Tax=Iris pallida TaxID=29817 RepID=A0AAX6G3B9_IRIPA|nr:protein NRT1/ PTR FAMILY 4.5-like [Iris pallida]